MKKKLIIYLIALILLIILAVLLLGYFVAKNLVYEFSKIYSENNIDEYESHLEKLINNVDAHSGLMIFPSKINENANVVKYVNIRRDGLFDGSYFFYIECKYSKDEFLKEKDRISNLKIEYMNETKAPKNMKYDNYDCYITISDGNGTYEYAIFDEEELKVVYLFNQLFGKDEINIDGKYIIEYFPLGSTKYSDITGYNMYYTYDKNGNGMMFNEL